MIAFAAIRNAIAGRLGTVDGLTVYNGVRDLIAPPCAWPILRPPVNLQPTMGSEADLTYRVFVAVGMNDTNQAQDDLDSYLAGTIAALSADTTLAGTVEDANCSTIPVYETRTADDGATRYLVAAVDVDCYVHQ